MKVQIEELEISNEWLLEQIKSRVSNTIVQKWKFYEQYNLENLIKKEIQTIVQEHKQDIIQMVANVIAKDVVKTKVVKQIEKAFEVQEDDGSKI